MKHLFVLVLILTSAGCTGWYAPTYSSAPSGYTAVQNGSNVYSGGGHWISSKSSDGSLIILEDGTIWQVSSLDRLDTMLWLPMTNITIVTDSMSYYLINTDDGEKAEVKYLGKK